jgi:hypothetical protein
MRPIPHRSDDEPDSEADGGADAEESPTEAGVMTGEEKWLQVQEF